MSESNLPSLYDPKAVEEKRYQFWLDGDYFRAVRDKSLTPYTIVIPPPNVTGSLHMGHALNNTIQDILIRRSRMQGFSTLWLPGCDHAGIATQNVVEKHLSEEGLDSKAIGREAFLARVWQWKDTYHERITRQLYRLGVSCDWSRERFTLDEGCSLAVKKVFVALYRKGLIYRGDYMINWCPRCYTALSDIEVEHEEDKSILAYIKYPIIDSDQEIVVATTRPETMLGDSAVAVNPEDKRYSHLVGKMICLPLMNREIPIVADEYVDPAFGTGAVKVTPGHDPNDFAIGERHDLAVFRVIGEDAKMTEQAGKYQGMDRYECRKKVLADLEQENRIERIDDYEHTVGCCQRCNTVVEPLISRQWFVRMEPLTGPALKAIEDEETVFVPPRFTKIYQHWLENIKDWCISRQIWWGHRIPAWYCSCGEIIVDYEEPQICPACGAKELIQDEDVLDTWFSSALWPFSTLGWPEKTPDLEFFYPTSVLVTGYDIIYFWVARMMFMGLEFMADVPFHTVYITGLVRDGQGRKMSKSLGNGIDPLDIIEDYGADTLRFTLVTGQAPGNDQRFRQESVEAARNFANKVWNASRFVLMNLTDQGEEEFIDITLETIGMNYLLNRSDKWILHRLNETVQQVNKYMDKYELGEAVRIIYEYLWHDFCDWYLEISKHYLYDKSGSEQSIKDKKKTRALLVFILDRILRVLHPFMPFISEEIWQQLPLSKEEALVIGRWPDFSEHLIFPDSAREMKVFQEVSRAIRNLRAQVQVTPGIKTPVIVRAKGWVETCLKAEKDHLANFTHASPLMIASDALKPGQALTEIINEDVEVYLPVEGVINVNQELERLNKELLKLTKEMDRTESKLKNKDFINKAPQDVIDKEKNRSKECGTKIDKLKKIISELGS